MPSRNIYENAIEFNAVLEYHAQVIIERLIRQLSACNGPTLLVLKNAHYLTSEAFSALYCYLLQTPNVEVVLAVTDETKTFPPLLEYVKEQHGST
jgi:hypothetical protein